MFKLYTSNIEDSTSAIEQLQLSLKLPNSTKTLTRIFNASLDVQKSIRKIGRGSELDFCNRLIQGRTIFILKECCGFKWNKILHLFPKYKNERSLKRLYHLHNNVATNQRLRYAWGHASLLNTVPTNENKLVNKFTTLDLGGTAPLEFVTVNGTTVDVLSLTFICSGNTHVQQSQQSSSSTRKRMRYNSELNDDDEEQLNTDNNNTAISMDLSY